MKKNCQQNRFAGFKPKIRGAKALTITAGDGTIFDFGDQAEGPEDISIGMTATLDEGGVPEGEYVMPDGAVWEFSKGTLVKKTLPILVKAQALLKEIQQFRFLLGGNRKSGRFGGFKPKTHF